MSFNAMAETIEESHRTLETQVLQKTLNLQQANAALELLYQSSRSLATRLANAEGLDELIRRFQTRLPELRLSLCLQGQLQARPSNCSPCMAPATGRSAPAAIAPPARSIFNPTRSR